jgi:glyoxylase-like metal-dependent hydrolase (beta-lactamase superfamily II)
MTETWTVGDATVTAIVEAQTDGIPPQLFFPDATPGEVAEHEWLDGGYAAPDGDIGMRVQAFLLQQPGRTTLVDPCVGNAKVRTLPFWHQLDLPWLERLREAGVQPADVDLVVHTHLHADHVGWDTHLDPDDGGWRPTFVNARHLYVGDELDHWRAPEQRVQEDVYADSVAPVIDAGLADIVAADTDLGAGLRLFSTPGHTPGHASLELRAGSKRFVISGDLMHHPVQLARPDWAEIGDWDAALARETRNAFLDEQCASATPVAGTHFPTRPVGHVEAHRGKWRFVPLDPV